MVDERVQAVRPHHRVDHPVAEARVILSPAEEPAVVEHVPLDADRGREIGELDELGQRVVEVHRLPHVERERTRRRWMLRPRPQPPVQPIAHPVDPRTRPRRGDRRRGVGLPRAEHDLARQQQLARADRGGAGCRALDQLAGVAAPLHTERPHLAVCGIRHPRSSASCTIVWSGPERPSRVSRAHAPTWIGRRCGWRSWPQCPVKSSVSAAWAGRGSQVVSSWRRYGVSTAVLVTVCETVSTPAGASSKVTVTARDAATSTDSIVMRRSARSTRLTTNFGDQSRPSRSPISAGRPRKPRAFSRHSPGSFGTA